MELLPVHTPLLKAGDDLASFISQSGLQSGDIIAVSSKVCATLEGAAIDLTTLTVSSEAKTWAQRLNHGDPLEGAFRQAILNETARMHGQVLDSSVYAMLTELKPDGLQEGTILAVNAWPWFAVERKRRAERRAKQARSSATQRPRSRCRRS